MNPTSESGYCSKQAKIADLFRALGHPARIAIIEEIMHQKDCADEIVDVKTIVPETTLAHLKGLKKAGLIKGTFSPKEGYCYCINWNKIDELKMLFDKLYKEVKQNKKDITEHNRKCIR